MDNQSEFSCTCYRYSKTMDEVIEAGDKHKKAAIAMKEVAEDLKKRIRGYRDSNIKLQDGIENCEMDLKEQHEMYVKVLNDKHLLEKELKYNIEKIELKNDDIIKLEVNLTKQKDLSQKLLKDVIKEKENLEKELDDIRLKLSSKEAECETKCVNDPDVEIVQEVIKLKEDIRMLELENETKEMNLKEINEENKLLLDKIDCLEEFNVKMLVTEKEVSQSDDCKSLEDELSHCDSYLLSGDSFPCDECGKTFPSRDVVRKHMKQKHASKFRLTLMKLEAKLSTQKMNLAVSLSKLKVKEDVEKKKPCHCKRFCYITHLLHTWKSVASSSINSRFQQTLKVVHYPCKDCDKTFETLVDYYDHVVHNHESGREAESGGR